MIKIENTEVVGVEHAIRGMRNPKNSWDRSDSYEACIHGPCETCRKTPEYPFNCEYFGSAEYVIGPNDHKLMMQLASGGPVHAKYRRMIAVYVDITAPLYWWKEFDTYKVGTVANSCSTMHKIHDKEFTLDDFSCEHLISTCLLEEIINELNIYRGVYNNYDNQSEDYKKEFSKKEIWWQMIQLLPSSYNQKRTVMLNCEVLVGMYTWRKNHKLDEWHEFCKWIESLPYSELITGGNNAETHES